MNNGMVCQRAQNILEEMIRQFAQAGIPIPLGQIDSQLYFSRSSTRMGSCRKERGVYRISLSVHILEDEETVRNTIAHELVHTCRGCMNHGVSFQRIGRQVEGKLGIPVRSKASQEESERSGIKDAYIKKARYRISCRSCGAVLYRQKKSALVMNPSRYRCGKCGGGLSVEAL